MRNSATPKRIPFGMLTLDGVRVLITPNEEDSADTQSSMRLLQSIYHVFGCKVEFPDGTGVEK